MRYRRVNDEQAMRAAIRAAAVDPAVVSIRTTLAEFAATTFQSAGGELHALGHIVGTDRKDGLSPFGHGDDAAVAVSMLLRIGGQLVSAAADLIGDGRHYAGAALLRQLVEVEYLAWAFEGDNEVSARWLRSTQRERQSFFTPAKLRKAAGNRFRSVDYGHHCELGGHPVPSSWALLTDSTGMSQLLLSDGLGHAGRIWDHVVGWAQSHPLGEPILRQRGAMLDQFGVWKRADPLTTLPLPPTMDSTG